MRKLALTLAVAAACTWTGATMNRADAAVLGGPQGLRGAVEDLQLTDQVHCRPGRWHHRYRPHDGCFRYGYRGYYAPRAYYYGGGPYYGGPYYGGYGYRRWGGPGYGYWGGGPGVTFRFGF